MIKSVLFTALGVRYFQWFRVISALDCFCLGHFGQFEVGCFGPVRLAVSALGHFGPESFQPNFNMVGYKHRLDGWMGG